MLIFVLKDQGHECARTPSRLHTERMTGRDSFLVWVASDLYEAELALHNGDAALRRALWSRHEPVSILGAFRNAHGQQELDELFASLEQRFSSCTSYAFELQACDVGETWPIPLAWSTPRPPSTVSLAVTHCGPLRYTAARAAWKVVHRHADTVTE